MEDRENICSEDINSENKENSEEVKENSNKEFADAENKETADTAENDCNCNCGGKESKEKDKEKDKESRKSRKAEAEIEKLTAQLDEEQDKYKRLYAEFDNFRKRSAKERESVYSEAYCDALTQILPILDNLERAAQFSADDADSPMAKGVELTLKSFIEAMNKMGVFEIEALGKDFDPNRHNAVMHIEDESAGENKVVEVFMKGYSKGDKVLRYSMVKVAN